MRRWLLRLYAALAVTAVAFSVGVLFGAPVTWPFDVAYTLGNRVDEPDLRAPQDGKVRVVVVQHGLWRTSASMWRIVGTLEAHGYEVLNPGYRSTRGQLDGFADELGEVVAARAARGQVDEWYFVGHSMGGLVIEELLRRPGAPTPTACVYLGTPHRGAVLADLRRHWFLFRLAMGDGAAAQLATSDAFHARPIPFAAVSGTVVGDVGDGNPSIPGNDDGTVAVDEATFEGAAARVVVPVGHTRLTIDPGTQRQMLHFLRHRAFRPPARSG